ncbi:MAG TPA: response regulator transcription factor [Alphaproteobacteria bacterium]|nr:response regulator transcription factor [Alphaproteobacteria bacterium]
MDDSDVTDRDDAPHAIDIAIADKSPLVQSGLNALFGADERFRVVAVAADGERFMSAVDRLSFDIGIIGWEMPYLTGAGVLTALRGRDDAPRIIVYTGSQDPDVPRQAMALGAAGFCHKKDPPERLVDAVLSVARGGMSFPYVDVRLLELNPLAALTDREREILIALSQGLTNQQLAKELDISLNTVKFHLKNLYGKLGVDNRAQAVARYLGRTAH